MNIVAMIDAYKTALNNNVALAAWCTTNYGAAHRVHVGIDNRNPPDPTTPLIHLFLHSELDALDGMLTTVGASCGLADETLRATGLDNVVELKGVSMLSAFRDSVKTIIKGVTLDAGHYFGDIKTEYETVDYYPYFVAVLLVPVHYKDRRMRGRY